MKPRVVLTPAHQVTVKAEDADLLYAVFRVLGLAPDQIEWTLGDRYEISAFVTHEQVSRFASWYNHEYLDGYKLKDRPRYELRY